MNDKKTPNDQQFDEGLVEDFDFGEGNTEQRTPIQTKPKGANKKVFFFFTLIVIGTVGAIGYKFYGSSLMPSPAPTKIAATTQHAVQPAVPVTPAALAPATPVAQPTAPSQPSAATEPNFGDIAQAFSSADHPPQTAATITPPKPSTVAKAPVTEGSIQDLQKELFSPEKPPTPEKITAHGSATMTETQTAELTHSLNKLNQQIDYIMNKIKYLDSYSHEVTENLQKLNNSISAMDDRMLSLTTTTSTLSKDVGSVRNEMGQVRQVLKEDGLDVMPDVNVGKKRMEQNDGKISIEEPEYMLHAVIPGRAWLKSSKGKILTVAEGDTVGNYGKILVIDAANGVVLTSSGITFR